MQYRQLGHTGITVSEIGFGAWGIGGGSYGPVDDTISTAALCRAYELGITFYDTSDLYGNGRSEELIGKALGKIRSKIIIASKGGTLPHTGFEMPQDFSSRHIRNALEGSLRRLKTDYIDLYQLHSPTLEALESNPDIISTLKALQTEGKIRQFGLSARSPQDAKTAIQQYLFAVTQVNFNLLDHRACECGLFALAKATGAGVIGRTPLCFGFLTGAIDENTVFAPGDHRALWPKEQVSRWVEGARLFRKIAETRNWTPTHLALRFCLAWPVLSTVIPGILTPEQAEENAAISDTEPLTTEELTTLQRIYNSHEFYDPGVKSQSVRAA